MIDMMKEAMPDMPALVEAHFGHHPQALLSKSALANELRDLAPALERAAPVGLPGLPQVVVVRALLAAVGPDASSCLAALTALRQMDPMREIATAWQKHDEPDAASPSPVAADAWRIATKLAATPIGMDILQATLGRAVPEAHTKDFALLLKAAAVASSAQAVTPASMLRSTAVQTSVAGQAVTCACARLAGDPEAGRPHDWALNAVKNGLYSTAPGSDFAIIEKRLKKMGKWIDRASNDNRLSVRNPLINKSPFRSLRHGTLQAERGGVAIDRHRAAFEGALRGAAEKLRAQLVQQAPLARAGGPLRVPDALVRAAVLGHCLALPNEVSIDRYRLDAAALGDIANRLSILLGRDAGQGDDQSITTRLALSGLEQLPQVRSLTKTTMSMELIDSWLKDAEKVDALAPAMATPDGALRSAAEKLRTQLVQQAPLARAGGPLRVPDALVRAAVLDHCLARPKEVSIDSYRLDAAALGDIANRLSISLGRDASQGDDQSITNRLALSGLEQLPQVRSLTKTVMSMKLIDSWQKDANKVDTLAPTVTVQGEPWSEAIRADLRTAKEEAHGHDTRLPNITRPALKEALQDVVKNIEGGSRLRLVSGGVVGVGLRQITASMSALASALFVRARINAEKKLGRQAVFEIGAPAYAFEIIVGTQRQSVVQLGAGASVGPSFGIASVGGNFDALAYGKDSLDVEGIALRVPRTGRPAGEVRAELSALTNRLLDATAPNAADTQTSVLKELLQEFPSISVSRIGKAGEGRRRHGLGAAAAASVRGPNLRATGGIGVAIEAQRDYVKEHHDAAGYLKVDRRIDGQAVKGVVAGGVAVGPSVKEHGVALSSGNTDQTAVRLTLDVLNHGTNVRRDAVYRDGRLLTDSFIDTEHVNVHTFLKSLEPRVDTWARARVNEASAERTIDSERARVREFMGEMRKKARPTHLFNERHSLKPEAAAKIDAYRSVAMLLEHETGGQPDSGDDSLNKALNDAIESVWTDPDSVQPLSLRAYEKATRESGMGVNLVVQLGALHVAEASHINYRLNAK